MFDASGQFGRALALKAFLGGVEVVLKITFGKK
jgi:hypothetical protein